MTRTMDAGRKFYFLTGSLGISISSKLRNLTYKSMFCFLSEYNCFWIKVLNWNSISKFILLDYLCVSRYHHSVTPGPPLPPTGSFLGETSASLRCCHLTVGKQWPPPASKENPFSFATGNFLYYLSGLGLLRSCIYVHLSLNIHTQVSVATARLFVRSTESFQQSPSLACVGTWKTTFRRFLGQSFNWTLVHSVVTSRSTLERSFHVVSQSCAFPQSESRPPSPPS